MQRPASLHDQIMGMETFTDRLFGWLPEVVRSAFQDRRRQLLYVERQMQRRLINEFRAQARLWGGRAGSWHGLHTWQNGQAGAVDCKVALLTSQPQSAPFPLHRVAA